MTIDHDAIAAKVRQDRKAGTPGNWIADPHDAEADQDRYDTVFADAGIQGASPLAFVPHFWSAHWVDACRIAGLPRLEAAYLDLYDDRARIAAEWAEVSQRNYQRAKAAEAERDALLAHPYLPAEEISAIERGNRRWHGEYDTTVSVRWEPYKPDGQRQMKVKGRWQTMTHNSSDYFRWENCDRPAQVRDTLKGTNHE